ncbi:hypothetical protein SCLARK_001116 [Spiroplasma clarkii]|nr:hypothetical protein SCLARK_001116 [Spiroplasma clarkii]
MWFKPMKYEIKDKIIIAYGEEYQKLVKLLKKMKKNLKKNNMVLWLKKLEESLKPLVKAILPWILRLHFQIF